MNCPYQSHYLHDEKLQIEIGFSPDVLISFIGYDTPGYVSTDGGIGENNRFGLNALAGIGYWFYPNLGVNLRFSYSIIPYT